MKKIILLTITTLSLSLTTLFAQIAKEVNVGDFNTLEVQGNITVTITGQDTNNFSYKLPENADPSFFEWENKSGVLILKLKNPLSIGRNKPVKPSAEVTISNTNLVAIKMSSDAKILSSSTIKANAFELTASSSANIALDLDVKDLEINATTSSKITLTGKVEYLTIKATSTAYVNTITMECQIADITTSTSAECYATSIKRFEAKARTNSNIFYKGTPEIVKVSESSLGGIEHF